MDLKYVKKINKSMLVYKSYLHYTKNMKIKYIGNVQNTKAINVRTCHDKIKNVCITSLKRNTLFITLNVRVDFDVEKRNDTGDSITYVMTIKIKH